MVAQKMILGLIPFDLIILAVVAIVALELAGVPVVAPLIDWALSLIDAVIDWAIDRANPLTIGVTAP